MGVNSLTSVATNMTALSEQYRAIANNLANSNTTGFKRNLSKFHAEKKQTVNGRTTLPEVKNDISIDFGQGRMTITGRQLDLAISGDGFFTINTPKGQAYTRSGSFTTNQNGEIVDRLGRIVASDSGPIRIPADIPLSEIKISSDGTVTAKDQVLGKLKIVEFGNASGLKSIGAGCFSADKTAQIQPAKNPTIAQGYTEMSNVNAVEELVNLIRVSRLYEANSKSLIVNDDKSKSLIEAAKS